MFFTQKKRFVVNPNKGLLDPTENLDLCKLMYGNIDQVEMCSDCFSNGARKEYCDSCIWFIHSVIDLNICDRINAGLSPYCDKTIELCSQVIVVCDQHPCDYKVCNPGDACYSAPPCEQNDLACICNLDPNL